MLTILCYTTYKAVTLPKKISKRSSSADSHPNASNSQHSSHQKNKQESEITQEKGFPPTNHSENDLKNKNEIETKEIKGNSLPKNKEENKENNQNADEGKKKEKEEKKRREKEEAELKKKLENDRKKLDEYEISEEVVTSGIKMEVRKAIYKKNKEVRVVKIYRKKDLNQEEMKQIQNEIKTLSKLVLILYF